MSHHRTPSLLIGCGSAASALPFVEAAAPHVVDVDQLPICGLSAATGSRAQPPKRAASSWWLPGSAGSTGADSWAWS